MTLGVSVPELLRSYLLNQDKIRDYCPGGVYVGPVPDASIGQGALSLSNGGQPAIDKYVPMMRMRVQIECIAPTRETADDMERAVYETLHMLARRVMYQPSNGEKYLVSSVMITGGPVSAPITEPGKEGTSLLYAEVYLNTTPVPVPA